MDNESSLASGHSDVPLSTRGEREARERPRQLEHERLDAVFSSDLQRAYRTAEIAFSARDIPLFRDSRLRECDYGLMTQHPAEEIDKQWAQRIFEPFPGGESVLQVVQRVGDFLAEVLRDHEGKTILVIGHRATRYGIEYWTTESSLESIVQAPFGWLEIPIWRYELTAEKLERARTRLKKRSESM